MSLYLQECAHNGQLTQLETADPGSGNTELYFKLQTGNL